MFKRNYSVRCLATVAQTVQEKISRRRIRTIDGNGFGYGFVAEKSAGIFPMNNEYTKKR
tara:strand:+ start:107 stop:283 length:177 start_codon:yes stop_codon:yes gene_type:complete